MGSIKDRNGMGLTEAEAIKKRWQEYTGELYKKDLHNQDNHNGTQSCPTLCDPIQSMEFSRPEYWSGWPFHSPGDLPSPGIEPGSPTLQADVLPSESSGKPYINVYIYTWSTC